MTNKVLTLRILIFEDELMMVVQASMPGSKVVNFREIRKHSRV